MTQSIVMPLQEPALLELDDDRILQANVRTATIFGVGPEGLVGAPAGKWIAGIERDGALRGAPGDWRAFTFIPPKGPDVDAGRNSSAMIAEYKAGMRTLRDIYGESGRQWQIELRQRADEVAEAERLANERGITRAEVLALDPNELSSANAAAGGNEN